MDGQHDGEGVNTDSRSSRERASLQRWFPCTPAEAFSARFCRFTFICGLMSSCQGKFN